MSNNRIGIVALGKADNYGAVLQSFSLCNYIKNNIGDCEIIDFTPKFFVGRYKTFVIDTSGFKRFVMVFGSSVLRYPSKLLRKIRFNCFRHNYCSYSKKKYYLTIDDDYRQYIVGSDQVFNLDLTCEDREFFLPRVSEKHNKVTFAASLGVASLTDNQACILKKELNNFSAISIREDVGMRMIQDLFPNRDIYHHLDPVFLTTRDEWNQITPMTYKCHDYILIYTFKDFNKAYKIAKMYDEYKKIYYINDNYRREKPDVYNIKGVGPLQFLGLIKYAKFIITDSYHGTAFSVIFQKNFVSIPYYGTESRFFSMLGSFGLTRKIYSYDSAIDFEKIDYNTIENKIISETERSYMYLKKVLR